MTEPWSGFDWDNEWLSDDIWVNVSMKLPPYWPSGDENWYGVSTTNLTFSNYWDRVHDIGPHGALHSRTDSSTLTRAYDSYQDILAALGLSVTGSWLRRRQHPQ